MSVRVIVVRREKDIIQVFPASLVGERGEKKLVVTASGESVRCIRSRRATHRRITRINVKRRGRQLILPSPFFVVVRIFN